MEERETLAHHHENEKDEKYLKKILSRKWSEELIDGLAEQKGHHKL